MDKLLELIGAFTVALLLIIIVALLLGIPIKLLWNCLMPTIFELNKITVWQAIGLNILSGLLIRSNNIKNK